MIDSSTELAQADESKMFNLARMLVPSYLLDKRSIWNIKCTRVVAWREDYFFRTDRSRRIFGKVSRGGTPGNDASWSRRA